MFKVIAGTIFLSILAGLVISVAGVAFGFVGNYYIVGLLSLASTWMIVKGFTLPTLAMLGAGKGSGTNTKVS